MKGVVTGSEESQREGIREAPTLQEEVRKVVKRESQKNVCVTSKRL